MLWRAVLTAIAISCTFLRENLVHVRAQGSPLVQIKDVICVLLLSGLQKDELDANTLEKLRRYNVNIYDMNNESLRQECLSKSLDNTKLTQDTDTSQGKNISTLIINLEDNNEKNNNPNAQKTEIAASDNYFEDKTNLRNLMEEMKRKGIIPRKQNDNIKVNNMVEKRVPDVNLTVMNNKNNKEPEIEYIQNQPSLDSVMKFWNRFAHPSSPAVEITTTYIPPTTEEISTRSPPNNGFVHSKEMDYVNKLIAEYLATQTEATTTQVIKTKSKGLDIITRQIEELLGKKGLNQEIEPIFSDKNVIRTFGDIPDIGRFVQINNRNDNGALPQLVTMPTKIINNEQLDKFPAMPYNVVINNRGKSMEDNNSAQKMKALEYLDSILRLNKELKMGTTTTSYTEKISQDLVVNNEKQINRKSVPRFLYSDLVNNATRFLTQEANMGNDQVTVSADVIQSIAEKVKEIVMKDIRKEIPATEVPRSKLTTYKPSTTTKTVQPTIGGKQTKDGYQMMQKIMELFKELNIMKQSTISPPKLNNNETTTFPMQRLDHLYAPIIAGANPYAIKAPGPSNVKQIDLNSYNEKFVPIPLGPADRALQGFTSMPIANQKKQYRPPPITFQTNSGEIPPLAIHVSKPLIDQHIIVTTSSPYNKNKGQLQLNSNLDSSRDVKLTQQLPNNKQILNDNFSEILNAAKARNRASEDQMYSDLTKKLRIAEDIKNEFRDSYRLQKLKDRINFTRDRNREKARELSQTLGTGNGQLSRLLEPNYQGMGHIVGSGHHDALNRHLIANYPDMPSRGVEAGGRQESLINQPINPHNNINRPLETARHESINRPMEISQYDILNRADDLNQRDIITREVLSRLVGSNHHDVISRLVEPGRQDAINRPLDINQQSRTHHSDAYERIEHESMHPRYKSARFHEELERGRMPRNNHKPATCCDVIAARQQMPLTKVKQNARFDDTHFRNFLKSQQKVTDMLEKILAAKIKPKPQSVETP